MVFESAGSLFGCILTPANRNLSWQGLHHTMARSLANLAAKCNLPWTTTTLILFIVLLLQVGVSFALADSSLHALVPANSQRHAPLPRSLVESAASAATTSNVGASYRPPLINFNYQGGLVLTKSINIYIIWYGAWAATEKSVIRTALSSLTPAVPITDFPNLSNLWTVMTKYYQDVSGQATFLTNNVTVAQEIDDGSVSTSINSSSDPVQIVKNNIGPGYFPADYEQGVYFVLTASDITYTDFPEDYCGYHNSLCLDTNMDCKTAPNNLVYAFVPVPTNLTMFRGCNLFPDLIQGTPPNFAVSPSGELDSMVSIIMHELLELSVDPYPNYTPAWIYNVSENSETGDLCSYNFVADEWFYCGLPSVYPDFNTSDNATCTSFGTLPANGDPPRSLNDPVTNVSFNQYGAGGSQYLVQKIWSLDNKGCVVQQEDACPTTTVSSLDILGGNISRGYFFNGVGLQAYAPGQNCTWQIEFSIQKTINFTFEIYALGYDALDYIQVLQNGALVTTLTGFGSNVVVTAIGTVFNLNFVTDGSRSPYPISAGFKLTYAAV